MSWQTFFAHAAIHATGHAANPLMRPFEQAGNAAMPLEVPGVGEIFEAGISGWLSSDDVKSLCLLNGVPVDPDGTGPHPLAGVWNQKLVDTWNKIYYARQELPTVAEMFILTNRGVWDSRTLDFMLESQGYANEAIRAELSHLRFEVPGPSDLVRFAVRHIFEPDLIAELGYPDERDKGPFLLDIYHQAAGINYPIFTGPLAPTVKMVTGKDPAEFVRLYAAAGIKEPTWADAYWWAHWVLPSPSQAYEMYFKLRPDRDRKFDPPEAKDIEFPYRNLDLLLRANDYPPIFRPMLAAIARPIPGIRFIRQLRQYGVYDFADVFELFQRMGYAPRDAEDLAKTVEANVTEGQNKGINKDLIKEVVESLKNGIMTAEQALATLVAAGVSNEEAAKIIKLAQVQEQVARAKELTRIVKSNLVRGKITGQQAVNDMLGFGLVATWVHDQINVWEYTMRGPRREFTALETVRYACQGLMSLDELAIRLTNLGYSDADIRVLVAQAQACAAGLAARAAARTQAQLDKAARALKQQQREAAQAIMQARRTLASHGSPAQLRKWFCEGHLGEIELYERLRQLGWPDADIARLVGDCKASAGGPGGARAPRGVPAAP
jgi:hypothetical protein